MKSAALRKLLLMLACSDADISYFLLIRMGHSSYFAWARGYFVSTVGRDEAVIREYIRNQEQEDSRLDQMNLWR
jgi:hypothetical protein